MDHVTSDSQKHQQQQLKEAAKKKVLLAQEEQAKETVTQDDPNNKHIERVLENITPAVKEFVQDHKQEETNPTTFTPSELKLLYAIGQCAFYGAGALPVRTLVDSQAKLHPEGVGAYIARLRLMQSVIGGAVSQAEYSLVG